MFNALHMLWALISKVSEAHLIVLSLKANFELIKVISQDPTVVRKSKFPMVFSIIRANMNIWINTNDWQHSILDGIVNLKHAAYK